MEVKCRFDESKYVLKIYNNCYGGGSPRLKDKAKEYCDSMLGSDAERLLLTVEKFGEQKSTRKTNGHRFTSFGFCLCPIECSNFCNVDEYDGLETPYIDNNEFLKSLINDHFVTNNTLNKEQYSALMKKSINVELEDIELKYYVK